MIPVLKFGIQMQMLESQFRLIVSDAIGILERVSPLHDYTLPQNLSWTTFN